MDWSLPYASHRMPTLARNVVSTSQPLAAQAGLSMMQIGGNAVDAALATAIALTVVEPIMNGIGGDMYALVWDGHELHGLNATGAAPAAWRPSRFAGRTEMPRVGWDSVTVPGQVAGWLALSERFGVLPFERLFEPAIRYAREGFPVSPVIASVWPSSPPWWPTSPALPMPFCRAGGRRERASSGASPIRPARLPRLRRAVANRSIAANWPNGCCSMPRPTAAH